MNDAPPHSLSWDAAAQTLHGTLRDVSRGKGAVAVVGGSMTSGKSTLLHALCDEAAQQGGLVLEATASRDEEHLHFGVVQQLMQHAPDDARAEFDTRLHRLGALDHAAADPHADPDPAVARTAYTLGTELLKLCGDRLVVLAIDDAQFLDAASLQCLMVAARRIRPTRALIVATTCHCPHYACRRFVTCMSQLSRTRYVRLGPLSAAEIETLLRARLDEPGARALAPGFREITGGNLQLVNALAQDLAPGNADTTHTPTPGTPLAADPTADAARQSTAGQSAAPRDTDADSLAAHAGHAFRDVVLACIDRCTPENLAVLQASALMGEHASTARIAALTELDRATIAASAYALTAAGLLADGGQCPPAVASTVTDDMPAAARKTALRRFAELLFEENADPNVIAQQLVAAGAPAPPWATDVLRTAAEEQFATDPETALRYVRAARRLAADETDRASLTMTLASLSWRTDPESVRRYLPELVFLLRAELLAAPDAELAIRYLLWFGRTDDAADALERLLAPAGASDPGRTVELRPFVLWASIWYPDLIQRIPAAQALRDDERLRSEAVGARSVEAGNIFDLILRNGQRHEIAAEAQRLLESRVLDDHTLDSLMTALLALLHADEVDCAAHWCETLLTRAWARRARIWQAQLSGVRAEIALRSGRLRAAAAYATHALARMPAAKWGVRVGLPLGTLVRAAIGLGDYERAAQALDQPVPPEMLETSFGMLYLQARGQYLLATGSPQRARVEFKACLDFMRQRGVELPNLLPWRTHLADVHVRLGNLAQARALAEEHLELTATHGGHWARGIALRLLARTRDAHEARTLLTTSVMELRASGARLELAATLTELSRSHRAAGESAKAAQLERYAQQIVASCGTARESAAAARHHPAVYPAAPEGDPAHLDLLGRAADAQRLSTAEQRVAMLAANGRTNAEIARQLFVTVSTVEQHLTHIYRKLKIRGRTELVSVADLAPAI